MDLTHGVFEEPGKEYAFPVTFVFYVADFGYL
jgi:hypothetical protein